MQDIHAVARSPRDDHIFWVHPTPAREQGVAAGADGGGKTASRTKKAEHTYVRGRYWRLTARCGKRRAAIAVRHTILRIVYHVLVTQEPYREPVLVAIDDRRRVHAQRRALAQLTALGYEVTLTPTHPAA